MEVDSATDVSAKLRRAELPSDSADGATERRRVRS